ncbi:chaperone DNAJ protein [Plasmodium gonderi]|uniref:Chaperone DNAJ protein n=1 Tax=Plasmodium gonderi TaxID=77519 RepID=A0A1Y1JFQ4_PLAGO|nr:chaperone DNAJ protein [Plasmodium gonderi]GAW79273.1 chaperone DNAJ protein [Plasmodium gonderi]
MSVPLRILRKTWNENLILERNIFTQVLRGKVYKSIGKYGKREICSSGIGGSSGGVPFLLCSKRNIHISRRCMNQDPYTVLGLSRNATTNDIKKQFRLLAKKYHPDINPSPDAKQKMASITAAYELLSDPKKKEFYDKTGMTDDMHYDQQASASGSNFEGAFSGFGDASFMFTDFAEMFTNMAGSKTTSTRGEDIQTEITLKFMEAIKGCEKNIRLNVKVSCNNCNGSGKKPGTNLTICKVCNGSGIQRIERGPIIIGVPCRNCSGNGQIINNPCKQCSGSGVKFQTKNITLDIPPGIKKGMQMRIPNQGHSGYRGGKNGHLFVTINIEPHKIFKWVDDNIHVDVPLTIKQCLLGGVINVPTLNGDMDLLIRPKTYPNSERVLKGKGPCKVDSHTNGDLVIKFSLKIPEKLTPRQVELIEEFNQIELSQANSYNMAGRGDTSHKVNFDGVGRGGSSNSSSNSSSNGSSNSSSNSSSSGCAARTAGTAKGEKKNVPEPPPIPEKKNSINNCEGKNNSNVPIPPPPPKSTRQKTKEQNSAGNKDTNLHRSMNRTYPSDDGNVKCMDESSYRTKMNINVNTNKLGNSSRKFDSEVNEDKSSHPGPYHSHVTNNDNKLDDFHETGVTDERRDNSPSTFSYAKKWISEKLKPRN